MKHITDCDIKIIANSILGVSRTDAETVMKQFGFNDAGAASVVAMFVGSKSQVVVGDPVAIMEAIFDELPRQLIKKESSGSADTETGFPEITNKTRADYVRKILEDRYGSGVDEGDYDTMMRDLLTDIRHFCGQNGLDFHELCNRSYHPYLEECQEEQAFTLVEDKPSTDTSEMPEYEMKQVDSSGSACPYCGRTMGETDGCSEMFENARCEITCGYCNMIYFYIVDGE